VERRRISSGSPYEPIVGFSRAVVVGKHVFVGGTAPVMPEGQELPDDPYAQARRCLEIIVRPVSTMVVISGLLDPRFHVEIEAEAILD
jgi:enamine deaminase RidA (YjgF/YER057c/UK114 family)